MKSFLPLILAAFTQVLGAQEVPEGPWAYQDGEGQTVFRFSRLPSGEVQGQIVSKTGYSETSSYSSQNPDYNGIKLLNSVWIWGLIWKAPGLWVGGILVDIRNDQGKLYYCQLRLSPDGTILTITIGGVARKDRTITLQRVPPPTEPAPEKPPPDPVRGNLVDNLWKDNNDLAQAKEQNKKRPVLNPVIRSEPNGGFSINIFTFEF